METTSNTCRLQSRKVLPWFGSSQGSRLGHGEEVQSQVAPVREGYCKLRFHHTHGLVPQPPAPFDWVVGLPVLALLYRLTYFASQYHFI